MDLKTLEYMEERAKKARAIVKEIVQLSKNIENINEIKSVRFLDHRWNPEFDSSTGDLTNELKEAYLKIASNKIDYLKQKLAEI